MDPFDIAVFNAAVVAHAAPNAPSDYDGGLGTVDVSKPVDYTGDWGKIIVDGGNYSIRLNMGYAMWVHIGKPAAATLPTDEQMTSFIPHARRVIARGRIYSGVTSAGLNLMFRAADIVDWATVPQNAAYMTRVDELYAVLTDGEAQDAATADYAFMILHELVANAIHRSMFDDHNWFTDEMADRRSETHKICAIAGRRKADFVAHMTVRGHDASHHLHSATLNAIVNALTGVTPAQVPIGAAAAPGGPADAGTPVAFVYHGTDIRGLHVHEMFPVGPACKDRWPPSELGKGAVINGIREIGVMLSDIMTRVKVTGGGHLGGQLDRMATRIGTVTLGREIVQNIESAIGHLISQAHGYCIAGEFVEVGAYKSLDAHSKRVHGAFAQGTALLKAIRAVRPHEEALTGRIVDLINAIGSALMTVGGIEVGRRGTDRLYLNPVPPHAARNVTAEVGRGEMQQMAQMMAATNRGGSGDVFHDARS